MSLISLDSGHLVLRLSDIATKSKLCMGVHQIVMQTFVGPPPEGMEVRHLNGDPADNRLENLKYGTRLENQRDRYRHGTDQFGVRNHQAKLTEAQVVRIRELYATGKYLHKELAAIFGVTRRCIGRITKGSNWPNAGGPVTNAECKSLENLKSRQRKAS